MILELHGLELFGRHGVDEDERRDGQTFFVDVTLHVAEPAEDSVEATYDYRRARDVVRNVNERASYRLLETFAAAVADALVAEPGIVRAGVRVRKPGISWAEWTAASVERP
jgi:7,8-dihydroneopterin aldolase/epimerase/oxygenase